MTEVITPSTVVVVGTQTITSALPETTVTSQSSMTRSLTTPTASSDSSSSSGLSSGARAGVIAGSVVGGIAAAALLAVLIVACVRRTRRKQSERDQIKWPEVVASAEDRAALYPQSVNPTGRAGVGPDMEEIDGGGANGHGSGAFGAGAGAAGVGAAGAVSRSYSTQSRQPTLPSIPQSVLDSGPGSSSDGGHGGGGGGAYYPTFGSAYSDGFGNAYGDSYAAGAAYPASAAPYGAAAGAIPYSAPSQPPAAHARQTSPSPGRGASQPATAPASADHSSSSGHDQGGGYGGSYYGAHPQQSSQHLQVAEEIGRPVSPTDMQVGDGPFGRGYDESEEGGHKRWRLSVVNQDGNDSD